MIGVLNIIEAMSVNSVRKEEERKLKTLKLCKKEFIIFGQIQPNEISRGFDEIWQVFSDDH